ncbi:MAG: amidase [Actinobacteria bacterium]|nr:amidase [Actinomycetota bacterium]
MFRTLAAAARAIAAKETSPLEVTRACLDRIERFEGDIRAFLHVDAAGALAAAQSATEDIARDGSTSPLHGIPIAIKDLIDVAGMPTTAASKVFSRTPSVDAPVVARLREAGAIVIGKTNLDAFAYGVFSEPTRNPWDLSRIPGGSSGGSAAAVAAGMCLGALGTDTAGSIRIPAAFCGVAGLKARGGSVPRDGIVALAPSLDSCGPIARSVEDLSLMWAAMTGSGIAPSEHPVIGIVEADRLGDINPATWRVYAGAIAAVRDAGMKVVVVDLPDFEAWRRPAAYLLVNEALKAHREAGWFPERAELYDDIVLGNLRYAEGLSPERIEDEVRPLIALRTAYEEALGTVTAILIPTTPLPAPTVEGISSDPKLRRKVTVEVARYAASVNLCAAAAVTIPWDLDAGLPVGVDVVGATEESVLAVARRLEALAPGVGIPPDDKG